MDECTAWELTDIVENIPYMDRTVSELLRLNAYINAKANFKGIKTTEDICKFAWENKDAKLLQEEHNYEISKEEIENLKNIASQWEKED